MYVPLQARHSALSLAPFLWGHPTYVSLVQYFSYHRVITRALAALAPGKNMSVAELETDDDSTVVFVITLSSLFFQLSELVEQLKAQLELEEVSDNPDNIATVLTNLKHQGEATLDSIHTAIDEGETIIEELKLASSDGVDSSSLQHVEKVIKELDRVRRAIEHSWTRRRQQLECWLQLREFERSAKVVSVFLPSFLVVLIA